MPAKRKTTEPRTSLPAVLEAGLRIADTDGLDALTMRRVADELGVGAMTLYSYVRTKEELVDGIATMVLNDLPAVAPDVDPWEERLEIAVHHLHVALREHPGVAQIVSSRRVPIPALDRFRETLLDILAGAGFDEVRAAQCCSTLAAYAAGFAAIEGYRSSVSPADEAARLRGLSREEFPRLSASADAYAHHVSQDAFTLGLKAFIAGVSRAD